MRIDQYLWYTRIYKSRTLASNACKKGHVKIDSKSLKPSSEVYPNMTFVVKKNQSFELIKILIQNSSQDFYKKYIFPLTQIHS